MRQVSCIAGQREWRLVGGVVSKLHCSKVCSKVRPVLWFIFVVFLIVFLATPNVITHIDPLSGVCVDVYNLYLKKFLFFASKTFVNRFNVIVRQFF